jgi:nucleoid DNA-binding protein
MTRSEVTDGLARKLGLPRGKAEQMVETVSKVFSKVLLGGGKIRLQGFGTFSTRTNPQRKILNQKNKKWYVTERNLCPYFKPSRELKQLAQHSQPHAIDAIFQTGKQARRFQRRWDAPPRD